MSFFPKPEVSDAIGVDDCAYKKRHTYGTIIVNEKTHEPIALLDGRNGDARNNKKSSKSRTSCNNKYSTLNILVR